MEVTGSADGALSYRPIGEGVCLASGSRAYGRRGLSPTSLSRVPSEKLQPCLFSACPTEVAGAAALSKSALKKAMMEVQWTKLRAERESRKAAAAAAAATAEAAGAGAAASSVTARAAPGAGARKRSRPLEALDAPEGPVHHPVLAMDCAFDALMSPSESCSLTKQIIHAYAAVKRRDHSPACARLLLTGLSAERIEALGRVVGASAWRLYATPSPLEAVFPALAPQQQLQASSSSSSSSVLAAAGCAVGAPPPLPFCATLPPASLLYLTSDATEVLWRLRPGTVYVIGGIVDRNRHKGLTLGKAGALGVKTARLPLPEALEALRSSSSSSSSAQAAITRKLQVLTTNKVVQLLCEVCSAGTAAAGRRSSAEGEGAGAATAAAAAAGGHAEAGEEAADLSIWMQAVSAVLLPPAGAPSAEQGGEGEEEGGEA